MAGGKSVRRPTLLARSIRLHRWLGLAAVVALLMFAGSGLIHPLMSRTQPQPQGFAPPPLQLPPSALALTQALDINAIDALRGATLVQAADRATYRIALGDGSVRYLDATDGRALDEFEVQHAQALARHFSGEHRAAVRDAQQITAFDDDYLAVNRLLPVWRVRFERDDGLTAYVDTGGQRLATLVDNRKRGLQGLFRALHTFSFIENRPGLRKTLMIALLLASAATATAGLVMFARLRRAERRLKRMPQRRWHRRLALPVSLTLFLFAFSGGWHLLHEAEADTVAMPPPTPFRRAELGDQLIRQPFTLTRIDGQPCYRVALPPARPHAHGEHHHGAADDNRDAELARCLDTHSGDAIAGADRALAAQLARTHAGTRATPVEITPVTQFSGEYGFINKRLPVWRVIFDGDPTRWYVETGSGALALRADDSDAREGWSFAYLHKWSFVANKDLRDALLMLFALLHVVIALLGLQLWFKNRRQNRAAITTPDLV